MKNITTIPQSFINEVKGEGYQNMIASEFEKKIRLDACGIGWHIVDGILFTGNPLSENDSQIQDTTNWTLFDLLYYLELN